MKKLLYCPCNKAHALITPQEEILHLLTNSVSQRDAFQCDYLRYVHVGRPTSQVTVACGYCVYWQQRQSMQSLPSPFKRYAPICDMRLIMREYGTSVHQEISRPWWENGLLWLRYTCSSITVGLTPPEHSTT